MPVSSAPSSSADEVPVVLRAPTSLLPSTNKRRTMIDRSNVEWSCIVITAGVDTHYPFGKCVHCGKGACWTAARIKDHVLGMNGSKACPAESEAFFAKKEVIAGLRLDAAAKKAKQVAIASSNRASEQVSTPPSGTWRQKGLQESMSTLHASSIDEAVAMFIFGENLSARIVESRHFATLVRVLSAAPPFYKLPHRARINGELLDAATKKLRTLDEPLREAMLRGQGCTVMCDGWDDVERTHLVNCLYSTAGSSFLKGTTLLHSRTHEDSISIANFLVEAIDRLQPVATVVQVTDPCSVMKRAWKIVERERPWVSATCCAPHVLNLLLKDVASITEVHRIMEGMEHILHRFWSKNRWPRSKLHAATRANHGKKLGLYRAKVTRFAGKVNARTRMFLPCHIWFYYTTPSHRLQYRQLSRALRLKEDLRQIVGLREYKDKFEAEDEAPEQVNIRKLVMSDEFWSEVINILKVALPLIKLLRACDNQAKEVMGKVYHLMFEAGEHLKEMQGTVLWAREAALFHEERWEYLHGRMHAAGYALDPEFLYNGDGGALDQATTQGLLEVVERLSLRALIQAAVDPVDAASRLTLSSAQVRKHAANCMTQFAGFRAKEANLTLPLVEECAQQMAPSRWWSTFCGHIPELQAIACSVLMQPVSASACERNWSVYGQIKSLARNRMQHDVADKRVYCHEALHYQSKLQNAGYSMAVEAWSESESDACSDPDDDEEAINKLMM